MQNRIQIIGYTLVTKETLAGYVADNSSYPVVKKSGLHGKKLAIVGGGPSLNESLPILQQWDGEIWSINRTHDWLKDRGVNSAFVTVDPHHDIAVFPDPEKVEKAIFASWCNPSVVKRYKNVETIHFSPVVETGLHGGSTTAVCCANLALYCGYADVTYFGCDSSFLDSDHIDRNENASEWIVIQCGNKFYKTRPDLYLQAQELSEIICNFPFVFKENSGGALRGMVNHKDWDVVMVSESLAKHLTDVSQNMDDYLKKYEGKL